MRTLASRGEENEDGREERDSLAPPRTWASNNAGREERKSKDLLFSPWSTNSTTKEKVVFSFIKGELGLKGLPHVHLLGFFLFFSYSN